MSERLGIIDVTVNRVITNSGYKAGKNLRFSIIVDKRTLVRLTRGNIGDRADIYFGTGQNIGKVRIYFNRPNGRKLSQYSGDRCIIQTAITDTSELSAFYFAHDKDLTAESLSGELRRAGPNVYLEVELPPSTYKKGAFVDAVKKLPEDPHLQAWHLFNTEVTQRHLTAALTRAGQKVKTPKVTPATQKTTTSPKLITTIDHYPVKDYLVVKQEDGDLWVRRSTINIDVFRVVNGQPVIRAGDGSEITLPLTPQELITAVKE